MQTLLLRYPCCLPVKRSLYGAVKPTVILLTIKNSRASKTRNMIVIPGEKTVLQTQQQFRAAVDGRKSIPPHPARLTRVV